MKILKRAQFHHRTHEAIRYTVYTPLLDLLYYDVLKLVCITGRSALSSSPLQTESCCECQNNEPTQIQMDAPLGGGEIMICPFWGSTTPPPHPCSTTHVSD